MGLLMGQFCPISATISNCGSDTVAVDHSFQCCTYSASNHPTTNKLETFNFENADVCRDLFNYLEEYSVTVVPWTVLNGKDHRVDDPCDHLYHGGQRVSVKTERNKWANAVVFWAVPGTDCKSFMIQKDKDEYDADEWVYKVKVTDLRAHLAIGATVQYRPEEDGDWIDATITNAYSLGQYDIEYQYGGEKYCMGNVDGELEFQQWWSTSVVNRCAELTCPFALSDWTGALVGSSHLELSIFKNIFKGQSLQLKDLNQQHECASMKNHMENVRKASSDGGFNRFDFEDSLDTQSQKNGANPIYRATGPACLECWRVHHFRRELKVLESKGVWKELFPVRAMDDLPKGLESRSTNGNSKRSGIYVARSADGYFYEDACMKTKVTKHKEEKYMITVYFKDVPAVMAWKGCTGACSFKLFNKNVSPINENTIIASDNGQSCTDACAATSSEWAVVHGVGETMMCIQGNKNNARSTVRDAVE